MAVCLYEILILVYSHLAARGTAIILPAIGVVAWFAIGVAGSIIIDVVYDNREAILDQKKGG